MIDSCGGVVSTAKETVSIARFPAASAASTVMEWPCSERFVSEYEVASVARSTGAPESKESCRVATPDPESLAVQVTVTSFESAYESGAGGESETEGAFGSEWKGTVTWTEFPASSGHSTRPESSPDVSERSVAP